MARLLTTEQRRASAGKFLITIMVESEKPEREMENLESAKGYVKEFEDIWAFRVYDEHGSIVHESTEKF